MSYPDCEPCPLCGYHAPEDFCPHCRRAPAEPSLARPAPGVLRGVLDGLKALPHGLRFLATTGGVKRLLVPPVVLTAALFGVLLAWAWTWLSGVFAAVRERSGEPLGLDPSWWAGLAEWLLETQVVVWLAHASSLVVLLAVSSVVALWTFSVVYEALAGPFLDAIQGRIEQRWFGLDPRKTLERTMEIPAARAGMVSAVCGALALALLALWWFWSSAWSWVLLPLVPAPFLLAGALHADYGRWLRWAVGTELRTLLVSLKASALAALLLLAFFWVKFIPLVGFPLFAALAGFATALTLLDIPCSRRRFSVSQRLTLLLANLPAVIALGLATSLVFIVPLFGPLIGVPAASIGGQWLLCRFDKDRLRTPARRRRAAQPAPASSSGLA